MSQVPPNNPYRGLNNCLVHFLSEKRAQQPLRLQSQV